jgi:hydrogenase maturation protein HypF
MPEKETYQISLTGIVQGVGFRPFVYNIARQLGLNGYVSNGLDGVKIVFNASKKVAEDFYRTLIEKTPAQAKILKKEIKKVSQQFFDTFEIRKSASDGKPDLVLTPDYAVCEECLAELTNPENRRFGYAFITCTQCGPRYSITTKLPFDRENTTMAVFEMCDECKREYNNANDSRFFSQTNSCPNCGVRISVFDNKQTLICDNQEEVIGAMVGYLKGGKILAIKGIGGYLLMCDATSDVVVNLLRQRKHRPAKPFAVMFPDVEGISRHAELNESEQKALESEVAPIVLLRQKSDSVVCQSVNPNLNKLGVMLPYSPLLYLICRQFKKPLVATSGNISGNPIISEDEKALTDFSEIADYIITHNRKIIIPQDDSVVQFTPKYKQKIIIRRSRGFSLAAENKNTDSLPYCLGLGASIKNTFALQTDTYLYISQYLGDLESFETQQNAEKVLSYFLTLFKDSGNIQKIYCDAHEGYFSTEIARKLSHKWNVPLIKVQHHEAHFSAVVHENDEINLNEPVLGVIWDGTGYGTDGNSWGGEFFVWDRQWQRIHFEYFDAILADKMPREPRISALCLGIGVVESEYFIKQKFTTQEWNLYKKLIPKNSLKTSSAGRIFDGVASILGLIDVQTYEGEAAILLEQSAQNYFDIYGYSFSESYWMEELNDNQIPVKPMIGGLLADIKAGKTKEWIAAKFHFSLVKLIYRVAERLNIRQIAFSGGVFQNALLVDLLIDYKPEVYKLFFHKNLSPNDENISYGQIHHSKTFQ